LNLTLSLHSLCLFESIVPTKYITEKRWEQRFPYDLWLEIFSYLTTKDLTSVARVCKTFYQIISDPSFRILQSFKQTIKIVNSVTTERYLGMWFHFNECKEEWLLIWRWICAQSFPKSKMTFLVLSLSLSSSFFVSLSFILTIACVV
jgi:hypothetical protein